MRFGGLTAVDKVTMTVEPGEIVGLIGPNGAGKTTLISAISGFLRPAEGAVYLKDQSITGLPPNQIARCGLVRTYQVGQPLTNLTVLENVMVGAYCHLGVLDRKRAEETAREVIEMTGLSAYSDRMAGQITLPTRKRLEVARALATRPAIMLLDEVIAGLNPAECEEAIELIRSVRDKGVSVLMVEHVMKAIMSLSDRIVVLHYGRKIAEGTPREIINNEEAIKAYLGESDVTS